eukprot:CAMPEP_0195599356 /NCGR_PEP_ID=MMETSP0815-20121206/3991_1 /TAXON_ID=97485 /ORGANISM="Prymnesium parvum, Strain Texoma1" /LENGTH=67 /DNA_ID=CAMNT_0040738791 /DNA_START=624 /DNA_END=828 /DNA_ORIENTATION=+
MMDTKGYALQQPTQVRRARVGSAAASTAGVQPYASTLSRKSASAIQLVEAEAIKFIATTGSPLTHAA